MILAREALERLREGNRRFAADALSRDTLTGRTRRSELATGQEPFAIILGCSDSRVPAEIVFDQGLGDLFVIRVAGNIVAPSQVGSVEFAAERFGTRLVVVLGPLAVRGDPGDARGAAAGRRSTSRATCARSSIACGRRWRRCSTTELATIPRRWCGKPCAPTSARPSNHLRHGSEVLERARSRRTACSSSAPSIRSRPGSSISSTAHRRGPTRSFTSRPQFRPQMAASSAQWPRCDRPTNSGRAPYTLTGMPPLAG